LVALHHDPPRCADDVVAIELDVDVSRAVGAVQTGRKALTVAATIFVSLIVCSVLFIPYHATPIHAYGALLEGGFGSRSAWGFTLAASAPLIFVALGTAVAWKSGFFYAGMTGSLDMGALAVTLLALNAGPGQALGFLPTPAFIALAIVAAGAAGAAWALIPAFLKVRFGGNELIVSLMLNFVADYTVQYLATGPLRGAGSSTPQTRLFPQRTWLPDLLPDTAGHIGFLFAIVAAIGVFVLFRRMTAGYEFRILGLNPRAAEYAGVHVGRRVLLVAAVAGGLCGLAGLCDVLGVQHLLQEGFSGNQGFLGAGVGLLGALTPSGAVIAALLYGGMSNGAVKMQIETGVPASVVVIIENLIVFGVLAFAIVGRIRRPTSRAETAEPVDELDATPIEPPNRVPS
jgi:simple sugar transport system permease protein